MTCGHGSLGMTIELDVPMTTRDGTTLRANVLRPDAPGRFPAILERTPYGKKSVHAYDRFVRAGYVVVSQDIRGRYASDGEFVSMLSGEHTEAEDGYDAVEWLAEQPYCNGKVGVFGISYPAFNAWMLAGLRPPHLAALCPWSIPMEASEIDWTCGSFRPARRVKWLRTSMAPDVRKRCGACGPHDKAEALRIWDELEQGSFLHLTPWSELANHLPPPLGEQFRQWLQDPGQPIWRTHEAHRQITLPHLNVSGWFDHCSSLKNFLSMQRHGATDLARQQSKIILGPWSHSTLGQRQVGEFDFGPQAQLDRWDLVLRWMDRWLKGLDNGLDHEPAVRYFVMGANTWKSADTWPPPAREQRSFYLTSDGRAGDIRSAGELTPEPRQGDAHDEYVYDPRDPVPTLWDTGLIQTVSDRRKLEYRRDILYYRTPPLERDVEVAGDGEVILHAASSAPDTDFFARLVDEPPEGPAMEVAHGMVRARYREGLDRERPLTPHEPTTFRIALCATACRFRAGHRIRLEITSSDYPNYDRNHNTGGNDLFETEMRPAAQRLFHGTARSSRLTLPITDE